MISRERSAIAIPVVGGGAATSRVMPPRVDEAAMTDTLLPGMVIGAIVRVFLIPGARLFRLFAAALLLPLGIWLCLHNQTPAIRQVAMCCAPWTSPPRR